MHIFFKVSVLFYCVLMFISCTREINDPTAYFHYVENEKNGLFTVKNVNDYTFSLQYKPAAYMALTDNENLFSDKKGFMQEVKEFSQFQYYTLRIKVAADSQHFDILNYHISSEEEYAKRLHYFEKDMQKDIKLICGSDTTNASSFLFEKETIPNECSSFLISFPKGSNNYSDRTVVLEEGILKTGKVTFTINGDALSNVPLFRL